MQSKVQFHEWQVSLDLRLPSASLSELLVFWLYLPGRLGNLGKGVFPLGKLPHVLLGVTGCWLR